ncbi:MAG: primosomal protein N' [Leptospirales bacterium]
MIVSVYVDAPWREPVLYYVPEKLIDRIRLYQRIIVDFKKNKLVGLVVHIRSGVAASEKKELEPISRIIDKESIINKEQFELSERVATHYLARRADILFSMIPSGRKHKKLVGQQAKDVELPELNREQKEIVDNILTGAKNGGSSLKMHLLHGVTGSGKTRVYIELIQKYMEKNLGTMLLLPEIALSYQFLEQLKPIFGDKMAILHSGLGRSFRLNEYKRVLAGEAIFVVGTRSAVFAPVKNLGLIVIDEEHDSSYKEQFGARYNAKWVAHNRLSHKGSWPYSLSPIMISGSATPLVETMYYAKRKVMQLHVLKKRATEMELPDIHLPKFNPGEPGGDILSPFLVKKMKEHFEKGKQVILLLNRRGYANFAFCQSCERTMSCPSCSVSLTHHKSKDGGSFLKCHLCGHTEPYTGKCTECGGDLKLSGKGIQKAEDAMEFHFPNIEYARMDQDSASASGFVEDVLEAMRTRKIQALIGTQMIAKGFDLEGVTLVGILNADIGLSLPDFRSPERVFQLLVQASGRAGRHSKGEVVMQTVQAGHYAIDYAKQSDYEAFYEKEIQLRKEMGFPPFGRLLRVVLRSDKEDTLWRIAHRLSAYISEMETENSLFTTESSESMPEQIYGPTEAALYKIKGQYRLHILAKDKSAEKLRRFGGKLRSFFNTSQNRVEGVSSEIDIDPIDML